MDNNLFIKILENVSVGKINLYNYHNSDMFYKFYDLLWKDILLLPHYTPDGRFEKILFEQLKDAVHNGYTYDGLFKNIERELNQLVVPCLILIPLNFMNNDDIDKDLILSDNIRLFKTDMPQMERHFFKAKKIRTALEKYYEKTTYSKFLREHIIAAKDKNFFNYPILTIKVESIDWKTEIESGHIASALYAIIRMLDFDKKLDCGGWGYIKHAPYAAARVYGVYYNAEHTSPEPPYDNGYGYSLRFQCSPILDISTHDFLSALPQFKTILSKYIQCSFCDKRKYSTEELNKKQKWQHAIQMFNDAYEFASIEKYDASLIFLLVILESLFVKNTGNKKENVVLALEDFYKRESKRDVAKIRPLITTLYHIRNAFVHEGNGLDNEYKYIKSMHDYQGLAIGVKPFAHLGLGHVSSCYNELKALFLLVIDVLKNYY